MKYFYKTKGVFVVQIDGVIIFMGSDLGQFLVRKNKNKYDTKTHADETANKS